MRAEVGEISLTGDSEIVTKCYQWIRFDTKRRMWHWSILEPNMLSGNSNLSASLYRLHSHVTHGPKATKLSFFSNWKIFLPEGWKMRNVEWHINLLGLLNLMEVKKSLNFFRCLLLQRKLDCNDDDGWKQACVEFGTMLVCPLTTWLIATKQHHLQLSC